MKLRAPLLFPAGAFEAADDLTRIQQVLDVMPDEKLIEAMEKGPSEGRPPRHSAQVLWRVFLGALLLGHRYMAQMLRELKRNGCGRNALDATRPTRTRRTARRVHDLHGIVTKSGAPMAHRSGADVASHAR